MPTQKPCRTGLIRNLSEKDLKGLKEMYSMLLELKRLFDSNNFGSQETIQSMADKLGGPNALFGGFKIPPVPEELGGFTYEQFEEELMKDIMVDHPDNLIIRFLRARKHNSKAAFQMTFDSVQFFHVQGIHDVIKRGERELLQYPLESGLLYFYGHDLEGNAILYLNVRHHKPKESPVELFSKIVMYIMAQGYLMLGDKKVTGIVDLKGLSLSNVEYKNVKFAADILANNFPEVLSRVMIINAPWIFGGIWSVVSSFLDPVVKEKIQFLSESDLKKFISPDQLPVRLGGANTHTYKYSTPSEEETRLKPQDDEYARLKAERKKLAYEFLDKSQEWVNGAPVEAERDELAQKLSDNFRAMSPYTWSPSYYHRMGFVKNFDDVKF